MCLQLPTTIRSSLSRSLNDITDYTDNTGANSTTTNNASTTTITTTTATTSPADNEDAWMLV